MSLLLALMGLLPRLGSWPKRVPCVPQIGLLNMRGLHVQRANFACAEFKDKSAKDSNMTNEFLFLKQRKQKCLIPFTHMYPELYAWFFA